MGVNPTGLGSSSQSSIYLWTIERNNSRWRSRAKTSLLAFKSRRCLLAGAEHRVGVAGSPLGHTTLARRVDAMRGSKASAATLNSSQRIELLAKQLAWRYVHKLFVCRPLHCSGIITLHQQHANESTITTTATTAARRLANEPVEWAKLITRIQSMEP